MAKDNCAAGLRSFHVLNSRGQLSSEMEISTPILNPREGILTGLLSLGASTIHPISSDQAPELPTVKMV